MPWQRDDERGPSAGVGPRSSGRCPGPRSASLCESASPDAFRNDIIGSGVDAGIRPGQSVGRLFLHLPPPTSASPRPTCGKHEAPTSGHCVRPLGSEPIVGYALSDWRASLRRMAWRHRGSDRSTRWRFVPAMAKNGPARADASHAAGRVPRLGTTCLLLKLCPTQPSERIPN